MSALGEKTLVLLLTDTESLNILARDGLNPVVIPTSAFREIYEWSLAFLANGGKAPSVDIMKERWGNAFDDAQIDIEADIEETIEWAIEDLKQEYVKHQVGLFTRKLATSIATATPEEVLDTLGERSSELSKVYFDLQPRTTRMDIRDSGDMILSEYEMAANTDGIRGMRIGLDPIDQHFGGIWPGELFVVGGPAGTGKSFFAAMIAYSEWARGKNTVLFTLENSILMTQMRIACMALHIDIEGLQSGTLDDASLTMLREWCNDVLLQSDNPLHIINPDTVGRTPQSVVQMAKALEAEALMVDQLSHMSPVDSSGQDRRNEVSSIVRMLADQISTGRNPVPCVLMHQINREGIKRAQASGRLQMTDFAESSEVERSASVACSLYQSEDAATAGTMQLQTLKVRRVRPEHWDMDWAPHRGLVHVLNNVDFSGVEGM